MFKPGNDKRIPGAIATLFADDDFKQKPLIKSDQDLPYSIDDSSITISSNDGKPDPKNRKSLNKALTPRNGLPGNKIDALEMEFDAIQIRESDGFNIKKPKQKNLAGTGGKERNNYIGPYF